MSTDEQILEMWSTSTTEFFPAVGEGMRRDGLINRKIVDRARGPVCGSISTVTMTVPLVKVFITNMWAQQPMPLIPARRQRQVDLWES